MISLDELGDQHVGGMNIPDGKGVARVMRDGTRQRQRRRMSGFAAFGVCVVAVGGLAVVAVRNSDSAETLVQVDAPRQTYEETVTEAPGGGSNPVDVVVETDSLPVRDSTELPLTPTPSLSGWTIRTTAVAVVDRFNEDGGGSTLYSLTSDGSELTLDVSSGQSDIAGDVVLLDRNGISVDAAFNRNLRGEWTLTWNERPGVNTGTTVLLSGPDRTELIDVASAIAFTDPSTRRCSTAQLPSIRPPTWKRSFVGLPTASIGLPGEPPTPPPGWRLTVNPLRSQQRQQRTDPRSPSP